MPCTTHAEIEDAIQPCSRCQQVFCPDCLVELSSELHCIDCKQEYVRDLLSGVNSASLELASALRRFMALMLDSFIVGIPVCGFVFGLSALMMTFDNFENPAFMLLFAVVVVIPTVLYEALMLAARGQTVGKMALGIKVVRPDGTDISRKQAWGRTFMRLVFQWMSCFALFDYLPALLTKDRTCIHDMAAATRVVRWRV